MSWLHPTTFVTLVLVALSLTCDSNGQKLTMTTTTAAAKDSFRQGEKETSLINSSRVPQHHVRYSYENYGVPVYVSRRRRGGQGDPAPEIPENSVNILRHLLLTPYAYVADEAPEPELINSYDYFGGGGGVNPLLRRPRHGQLHAATNNIRLTRRHKKALSVLSRCCPFWTSSSSTSTTEGESNGSDGSGGVQTGSGAPTARSQLGLGRRHYLPDYDGPSDFLRSAIYAGHSIRPYSMRLRWGK